MQAYKIVTDSKTISRLDLYLEKIRGCSGDINSVAGGRLCNEIQNASLLSGKSVQDFLQSISRKEFLSLLLNTKKPKSFAEKANAIAHQGGKVEVFDSKDGIGWSVEEVDILEHIGISVPVTVYDDGGQRDSQKIHDEPFDGNLLYIPGPVLKGKAAQYLPSYEKIVQEDKFQESKFIDEMKERLLPLFIHANNDSKPYKKAFITIPGISCGYFGGKYGNSGSREVPRALNKAIEGLLQECHELLPNIAGVTLDTFVKGSLGSGEFTKKIGHITFSGQELQRGDLRKQQLAQPMCCDNGSGCALYSFVAADALSWPGNDMNVGSRSTDEGVKTGATNAMSIMTGVKGQYDVHDKCYALEFNKTASAHINTHNIRIDVSGGVFVLKDKQLVEMDAVQALSVDKAAGSGAHGSITNNEAIITNAINHFARQCNTGKYKGIDKSKSGDHNWHKREKYRRKEVNCILEFGYSWHNRCFAIACGESRKFSNVGSEYLITFDDINNQLNVFDKRNRYSEITSPSKREAIFSEVAQVIDKPKTITASSAASSSYCSRSSASR